MEGIEKIGKKGKKSIWNVYGTRFEIDDRYDIVEMLGQGAYGKVVAAKDLEAEDPSNDLVAIKKIEKAFDHKIYAQRILRELKI
mmetsp:Transcript_23828/g.18188  ORF Transcript_23828/g.18188 Transcript_23828/m.18188 type:complete len:84 (-) Transcript_23828:938-1189(-)